MPDITELIFFMTQMIRKQIKKKQRILFVNCRRIDTPDTPAKSPRWKGQITVNFHLD
jgi:hypothetical protein